MTPKDERLGRVVDIEKEVEELLQDAREMETGGGGNAPGFGTRLSSFAVVCSHTMRSISNDMYFRLPVHDSTDSDRVEHWLG